MSFLEAKNLDGLAEATRVFGNLSRDKSVRDFLVENQGEREVDLIRDETSEITSNYHNAIHDYFELL